MNLCIAINSSEFQVPEDEVNLWDVAMAPVKRCQLCVSNKLLDKTCFIFLCFICIKDTEITIFVLYRECRNRCVATLCLTRWLCTTYLQCRVLYLCTLWDVVSSVATLSTEWLSCHTTQVNASYLNISVLHSFSYHGRSYRNWIMCVSQ